MAMILRFACVVCMTAATGAGEWYAGDLHAHSLYSDGDSAVADVLNSAASKQLDFFALTDHDNMMGGVPVHWFDPDYVSEELILLYGVEWTTLGGHANAWSDEPWDYADMWAAHLAGDPQAAADAIHAAGGLFSINHPSSPLLLWRYPVAAGIDCIEVWNGPLVISNSMEAAHGLWDAVLMEGRRVTGVGGSDTHHLYSWQAPFTGHGMPTTWVYAEAPTAQGILDGIAAGRVTISYAPYAPRVELSADADGDGVFEAMMGDAVQGDGAVTFRLDLGGGGGGGGAETLALPPGLVENMNRGEVSILDRAWLWLALARLGAIGEVRLAVIVADGDVRTGWLLAGDVDAITWTDAPSARGTAYYRAEVYGDTHFSSLALRLIYGLRIAVTNPIYIE